jgi:hypothetical protein
MLRKAERRGRGMTAAVGLRVHAACWPSVARITAFVRDRMPARLGLVGIDHVHAQRLPLPHAHRVVPGARVGEPAEPRGVTRGRVSQPLAPGRSSSPLAHVPAELGRNLQRPSDAPGSAMLIRSQLERVTKIVLATIRAPGPGIAFAPAGQRPAGAPADRASAPPPRRASRSHADGQPRRRAMPDAWRAPLPPPAPRPLPPPAPGSPPPPRARPDQIPLTLEPSRGVPLAPELRVLMRERIGFDPEPARIHTGAGAEKAARELGAAAFTIGRHVFFGAGRFQPASPAGRELLAHELTHVRQAAGGRPFAAGQLSPQRHAQLESEARQAGTAARSAPRSHPQLVLAAPDAGSDTPAVPLLAPEDPAPVTPTPAVRTEQAGPPEPEAPHGPDTRAVAEEVYRLLDHRLRLERERTGVQRWR